MKSRAVTIRQSLIGVQVAGILGLGLALFAMTFVGTRGTVRELLDEMMRRTMDHVVRELYSFFARTGRAQEMASRWIESGVLDTLDPEDVHGLALTFLELNPELEAFVLTDERGNQHRVERVEGEGWADVVTRPTDDRGFRRRTIRWNGDGTRVPTPWSRSGEDPREQDWYRAAAAGLAASERDDRPGAATVARLFIGEPTLREDGRLGVVTALAHRTPDGGPRVVAFEQQLGPLLDFSRSLAFSERGGVFIVDGDNRLLAIPQGDEFWRGPPGGWRLLSPSALGSPVVSDLLDTLDPGDPLDEALSFRSGGELWWAQARAVPLGPDAGLVAALLVPDAELYSERDGTRRRIIGSTVVALLLAIAASMVVARLLSGPIEELVRRSHRLQRGDLEPQPPIGTPLLEVRSLVSAQEEMRRGLASLLKFEGDLRVARQIQQATLPARLLPIPGYELAVWNQPADETGGDTYDVVWAMDENDRPIVHLLVADASGHGIGPALAVTQIRAMLRMAIRLGSDLTTIVRNLNEQLHADLPRNRFITAWFGELRPHSHTLTTSSAGQGPLLHYLASEDRVQELFADAQPFGMFPELQLKEPRSIALEPGDCFVVLSDGFFEAQDEEGHEVGRERICEVVRRHAAGGAERLLEELRREIDAVEPSESARDDRTALILRRVL